MGCKRLTLVTGVAIVVLCLAAGAPVAIGAQDPIEQATSMSTSYDGMGPSQEIQVRLTIEPTESKLSEVRLSFSSGQQTLIQSSSYASTVTPSNHDVSVRSESTNTFVIPELKPGETVQVSFTVVPTTLEDQTLSPATANVEFTRNGQRLSGQVSEEATLTNNPWQRAQSSSRPTWLLLLGGVVSGSIVTGILSSVVYRRRQKSTLARVESRLDQRMKKVKRAGDREVERRAEEVLDETRDALGVGDTDEHGTQVGNAILSRVKKLFTRNRNKTGQGDEDTTGPNL